MIFIGYDPGGNENHGVAALVIEDGHPIRADRALVESVEEAVRWFLGLPARPTAIGVDTLTCWSTGPSGWRPADRWLREQYKEVQSSVASSNSLYGSMSINGMAALIALKDELPGLLITETHPKVLHWHMTRRPYDWEAGRAAMLDLLATQLGFSFTCESDHEWDAVLSALVAFRGATGEWHHDLHNPHEFPAFPNERLVKPCGETKYYWPD